MTVALAAPVDVGSPPAVPICRSAKNPAEPCRFGGTCHESRQRIAHYATPALRGKRCWFYQSRLHKLANPPSKGGRAGTTVCFNCGADYSRDYWLEDDAATWQGKPQLRPDPFCCRACYRPASERRA